MEGPPAGNETCESIVDVVNCSDSTASITTVTETSLDEAVQVQSTSTNMNSGQSEVMNNESTGSLVSVGKHVPMSESNSQDAACPVMDVPIRRETDEKVVMVCMSLAEFNKIPVEQIVTVNPDETLNSSNLSSLSIVFGKTAAEALCERNAKKGIVNYSTTDEMISVDTFQMGKRGTVTGTQVHQTSSSDVVPDSTQVHQDKSSDVVSETSSTPLFKEDTGSIPLDDSSTKPNVTPDETKSSPNDDTRTDADVTAEGIQTEPDVTPDETKSPADEDTNPKPDVTPDENKSPLTEDTKPKPDVTPDETKSPPNDNTNPKPDVTPDENKSPPNDDTKPKPDVTPDENKSPAEPNSKTIPDKAPKPKRNVPKCRLDNLDKGMSKTGVVGGTGSVGDSCTGDIGDNPDKVTITVHSNIDSLVKNISDKFEDYVSKLGRKVNIKLSSKPVVKMTNITPADPIQKKKITKLAVTASVCGSDKKSLNIYLDEDLKLEEQIVAHHLQPAPTKGKQMSEYYFKIIRLFILFFISETLACQRKLVLLVNCKVVTLLSGYRIFISEILACQCKLVLFMNESCCCRIVK